MEALISNTQESRSEETFRAAKVAITRQNGDLLILWRSVRDEYRPGGADFPGGELERGESPVEAAVRETAEETGIRLAASGLYLVGRFIKAIDEADNPVKQVESTLFIAYAEDQEVDLGKDGEHDSFEWIAPKEVWERKLLFESTSKMASLVTLMCMQKRGAWPEPPAD